MIGDNGERCWEPNPELLAAYADGELAESADLRERIEVWLDAHSEAAEAMETQQQLTQWMQLTAAEEPGEMAWAALSQRLKRLQIPPRRRWATLAWLTGLGAAGAACLGLAIVLIQEKPRPAGPPNVVQKVLRDVEDDVLPVAIAAEVEILSVQGEDTTSLVVGELPLEGVLTLLTADELLLTRIEPAQDNMVPEMRKAGAAPVIYAPTDAERESSARSTEQ